jgi:hypothetical protein
VHERKRCEEGYNLRHGIAECTDENAHEWYKLKIFEELEPREEDIERHAAAQFRRCQLKGV